MSRPFRGGFNASRPENALKRAEELEKVGPKQRATALQTLHDVICSKKHRTWSKTFESIMFKHIDLCVEMKNRNYAKEALMQYRNMCHLVNIASLEEVIKYFLKKASDKAEEAQAAAAAVTLEVEDLEEDTSPEDLMLSYVSAEKGKDRTDREMVTPWFRFLWESYRSVLEILRTNPKLESLYCMTANKAFAFCLHYKRTTEFKRLCDILRQHLTNLLNRRDQREQSPDSFQQHLESRFEQLRVACELELWGEAFRSVEDIQQLIALTKKAPKQQQMAAYYTRLTQIFAVSDAHLYHAFAWLKLFNFSRQYNRTLAPQDLQQMATCVLLAALSTLPYDRAPVTGRASSDLAALEQEKERMARMATILGYPVDARRDAKNLLTRQSLLAAISASNLLALVPPEVRAIHDTLTQDFSPLDMCSRLAPLLTKLPEVAGAGQLSAASPVKTVKFDKYVSNLRNVGVLRLLRQLSECYSTLSIKALADMVPFATFGEVEAIIVDAVRFDFLQVRIDHRAGTVHFGSQQLESDRVRNHMALLAKRMSKALTAHISPPEPASHAAARESAIRTAIESMAAEHDRALARKTLIERRKEAAEQEMLAAEREAERERILRQREQEAADERKRKEEAMRRERDRIEKELEEQEQEETRRIVEANLKGKKAALLQGKDGEKLDKKAVMQDVLSERLKEQQELERKLTRLARNMDHLERARREEEATYLEAAWQKRQEEDRAAWEAQQEELKRLHREAWNTDIQVKQRLIHMVDDKEAFARIVMERRTEEFEKLRKERERRLRALREQRKHDREIKRRQEYVTRCRAAVLERIKDMEAAKRREEEERRRAEEAERQRKLEEALAKQRAREEEIERRLAEEKAAMLGRAPPPAAAVAAPAAAAAASSGSGYVPPSRRAAAAPAAAVAAPPTAARGDDGDRWGRRDAGPAVPAAPAAAAPAEDRWGRRDGPPPPRDDGDRWGRRDGPAPSSSSFGPSRDGPAPSAPSGGKFVPPSLRARMAEGSSGGGAAPSDSAPPPARPAPSSGGGGSYVPPSRRGQ